MSAIYATSPIIFPGKLEFECSFATNFNFNGCSNQTRTNKLCDRNNVGSVNRVPGRAQNTLLWQGLRMYCLGSNSEGSSSTGQLSGFPSYGGTGPSNKGSSPIESTGSNNYQSSNVNSGNGSLGPKVRNGILFPINRGEGIVLGAKGLSEVQSNPMKIQERPQTTLFLEPNKRNNIPVRNQDNSNRPRGTNQNQGSLNGARRVFNSKSRGNGTRGKFKRLQCRIQQK